MSFGDLPLIGITNHFQTGTVTTDGTNKENAYDNTTADYWTTAATPTSYLRVDKTTPVAADYVAIGGHDLFDQTASFKVQHGPDGSAWTDVVTTDITPTDNGVIFIPFDPISAQWWRVLVSGLDAAASIAAVSIGTRLQLERGVQAGFTPADYSRVDRLINSKTQNGQFLGRSLIRTNAKGTIDLKALTQSWVRTTLDAFILDSRTKLWFLSWAPTTFPGEVALCRTTATPNPMYSAPGFMSCKIDYEALIA